MGRQDTQQEETDPFRDNLPERLERLKEQSSLSWTDIADHLDVNAITVRRWRSRQVQPNRRSRAALLHLANVLGLGHLFTD